MLTGHHFRRIRPSRSRHRRTRRVDNAAFLSQLCQGLTDQFTLMTGLDVVAIPLYPARSDQEEQPPRGPVLPACEAFDHSEYCQESWQLHLAELEGQPHPHWHKCDYGLKCAIIPLVYQNQCLAVFKFVGPESMDQGVFESKAQLLAILVEHASSSEADRLAQLAAAEQLSTSNEPALSPDTVSPGEQSAQHPQVLRALGYIEEHLSSPKLTVAHIAFELDIHPDYLSHLFAVQVGQRMGTYIASRRIERAKNLLVTTHWQVKRIAHKSGFANSNWFYHVFKVHTGMTPEKYRRDARKRQPRDSVFLESCLRF